MNNKPVDPTIIKTVYFMQLKGQNPWANPALSASLAYRAGRKTGLKWPEYQDGMAGARVSDRLRAFFRTPKNAAWPICHVACVFNCSIALVCRIRAERNKK